MQLEEIKEILWEIYKESGESITKKCFGKRGLPSYNTCMRRGIRLFQINKEFSEKLYDLNIRSCKLCSKVLPYNKRYNEFCSQSCSATYHNIKRQERLEKDKSEGFAGSRKLQYSLVRDDAGKIKAVKMLSCAWCINMIEQNKTHTRKFCNAQCMQDSLFADQFLDWYNRTDSAKFSNRSLRKFIETYQGYVCSVCTLSEWNGKPITLEVEHIDGNSENNLKENVCLICPNCHSQTDTYKGKNKGNGRHSRRKRYHEGKSY